MSQPSEDELRQAVAKVTLSWAGIETVLAILLSRIFGKQPVDLAFPILFSLVGLESKITVVNAAFKSLLTVLPMADDVESLWKGLIKKIKDEKAIRNTVAHGALAHVGFEGKDHVRIIPPMFSPKYSAGKRKNDGPQGLGVLELEASLLVITGIHRRISLFIQLLENWHMAQELPSHLRDFGATSTYARTVRALRELDSTTAAAD
jgi:hypothetical protein